MSTHSNLKALVLIGFAIVFIGSYTWSAGANSSRAAGSIAASIPEIIVEINDTVVSPDDSLYFISVFLTNATSVAGFEIDLIANRPDLVELADADYVDTIVLCIDTVDCDPADTVISTGLDLAGSAIAAWELVDGTAFSPTYYRVVGIADMVGGSIQPPLAPPASGNHFLFRAALQRVVSQEVLDTLTERTVSWFFDLINTRFVDSNGTTLGTVETNTYVTGSLTIGPNCLVGDANGNGSITSADIIHLVNHVFRSGPPPGCTNGRSGDVNCSGTLTSSDVIYLVNYAFKSGPAPCEG